LLIKSAIIFEKWYGGWHFLISKKPKDIIPQGF
jgi:hypothetical protein